MSEETRYPVPPGLSKCPVCDEYKGSLGTVHEDGLSLALNVTCICEGIPCCRCGVNKVHRPISNSWTERGGLGHWPYFANMIPCPDCRAKQRIEDEERRRAKAAQPVVPVPEDDDSEEENQGAFLRHWSRPRKNA